MKWLKTYPPKHQDIRRRVVFLFLPKYCRDGYYHWLEEVVETQIYSRLVGDVDSSNNGTWKNLYYEPLEWWFKNDKE